MLSTVQLLDIARAHQGGVSDYRIAKLIGINPNAISNYRTGRSVPAEPIAMRLAEVAGVDPAEAIFALNAERASDEGMREFWLSQLRRVAGTSRRKTAD
ncbi:helix-turn-helix domain-containing protein [Kinneretia asaccharophila]|uniref:helix-turn-helix domain-containing protein n=1 Tax=Roseateles asaccharophilus TaxID=582607 RepID=UPI00105EBD59|nr:helix-turn-helix domain-containing protein [Roseateles asaccharophilus]MDN3544647.1 helix-turn-helix domain-containing protein [Roseateles asaccharophilus]